MHDLQLLLITGCRAPLRRCLRAIAGRHLCTPNLRPFIIGLACLNLNAATAGAPAWWQRQAVIDAQKTADDFAAANIGQVKTLAKKAADDLRARAPGGAGAAIEAMLSAWAFNPQTADDFAAVNLGQLKTAARPFYDRLAELGIRSAGYPWGDSSAAKDDFALANLGQVKTVFAFEMPDSYGPPRLQFDPTDPVYAPVQILHDTESQQPEPANFNRKVAADSSTIVVAPGYGLSGGSALAKVETHDFNIQTFDWQRITSPLDVRGDIPLAESIGTMVVSDQGTGQLDDDILVLVCAQEYPHPQAYAAYKRIAAVPPTQHLWKWQFVGNLGSGIDDWAARFFWEMNDPLFIALDGDWLALVMESSPDLPPMICLFHRSSSGEWECRQTLLDLFPTAAADKLAISVTMANGRMACSGFGVESASNRWHSKLSCFELNDSIPPGNSSWDLQHEMAVSGEENVPFAVFMRMLESRLLVAAAGSDGQINLLSLAPDDGSWQVEATASPRVLGHGDLYWFSATEDRVSALTYDLMDSTNEMRIFDWDGRGLRKQEDFLVMDDAWALAPLTAEGFVIGSMGFASEHISYWHRAARIDFTAPVGQVAGTYLMSPPHAQCQGWSMTAVPTGKLDLAEAGNTADLKTSASLISMQGQSFRVATGALLADGGAMSRSDYVYVRPNPSGGNLWASVQRTGIEEGFVWIAWSYQDVVAVQRSTDAEGPWETVHQVQSSEESTWEDRSLPAIGAGLAKRYYYRVIGADGLGPPAIEVDLSLDPDQLMIYATRQGGAAGGYYGAVSLEWRDNSALETGYAVHRTLAGSGGPPVWDFIGAAGQSATSFFHRLADGDLGSYQYRVSVLWPGDPDPASQSADSPPPVTAAENAAGASSELHLDSDADQMADWFEQWIIDSSITDTINSLSQVTAASDFDLDGIIDFDEFWDERGISSPVTRWTNQDWPIHYLSFDVKGRNAVRRKTGFAGFKPVPGQPNQYFTKFSAETLVEYTFDSNYHAHNLVKKKRFADSPPPGTTSSTTREKQVDYDFELSKELIWDPDKPTSQQAPPQFSGHRNWEFKALDRSEYNGQVTTRQDDDFQYTSTLDGDGTEHAAIDTRSPASDNPPTVVLYAHGERERTVTPTTITETVTFDDAHDGNREWSDWSDVGAENWSRSEHYRQNSETVLSEEYTTDELIADLNDDLQSQPDNFGDRVTGGFPGAHFCFSAETEDYVSRGDSKYRIHFGGVYANIAVEWEELTYVIGADGRELPPITTRRSWSGTNAKHTSTFRMEMGGTIGDANGRKTARLVKATLGMPSGSVPLLDLDAALAGQATPEKQEDSPGTLVFAVPADQPLVTAVIAHAWPYAPSDGHFRVSASAGLKLWRTATRTQEVTAETQLPDDAETTLYVEMLPEAAGKSDAVVSLSWHVDGSSEAFPDAYQDSVTLLPIDLAVDADRDGVIASGEAASQAKPLRFWINNDTDSPQVTGEEEGSAKDSTDDTIANIRDLEDFQLMRFSIPVEILRSASQGKSHIGLKWRDVAGTVPSAKLYRPRSSITSSEDYLWNLEKAESQMLGSRYTRSVATIDKTTGTPLPRDFIYFSSGGFGYTEPPCILVEGLGKGSGQLCLVLQLEDGTVIDGPGVWLKLMDVQEMFENVRGKPLKPYPNPPDYISTAPPRPTTTPEPFYWTGRGQFVEDPEETNEVIIMVHGWNMTDADKRVFSESFFKRLWWKGFKGRFCSFYWPTYNHEDDVNIVIDYIPNHFNQSEYVAWKYGSALRSYANSLSKGSKHVAAHSMGNIVAASALNEGMAVNSYVAMQAAIPAGCYDGSDAANQYLKFKNANQTKATPDLAQPDKGYRGLMAGTLASGINFHNFFNPGDYALKTGTTDKWYAPGHIFQANWEANEVDYKPDQPKGYYHFTNPPAGQSKNRLSVLVSTNPETGEARYEERDVTDHHEIMSFIARPLSEALGVLDTAGFNSFNLKDQSLRYPFGEDRPEHSGQYQRPIQKTHMFFNSLLDSMDVEFNFLDDSTL